MRGTDISQQVKATLMRINAITGWNLPTGPSLQILINETSEYLLQNCADMNPEEIAYAVRNFSGESKDWGKNLNIPLIDESVQKYRFSRAEVSEKENKARIAIQEPQKEEKKEELADWSDSWQSILKVAETGGIKELNEIVISVLVYDWLKRNNMITFSSEERWGIFLQVKNAYRIKQEAQLLVRKNGGDPLPEVIRRIELLNTQTDWQKDEQIVQELINESKRATVRLQAIVNVQKI
jgi:hypothetical protein